MYGTVRNQPGGIASLADAVVNHWDSVEADFQRFYGIDLRAYFGRESVRRIWVLVKALPADAALWRAAPPADAPPPVNEGPAPISVAEFRQAYTGGGP